MDDTTRESFTGNKHPLFAFAGIDGAGKTTLINGLSSELRIKGYDIDISKAYTQENKDAFEHFLADADNIEIMFMFQSFQRRQRNKAIGSLALGNIVLADRWNEPFEAFHSQSGTLASLPTLRHDIDELTHEGLMPNLTFYLQIKTALAMRRTHSRGADFFDSKAISYHKSQAYFYDKKADENDNWVTLDAHQSAEDLLAQALEIIEHSDPIVEKKNQQSAELRPQ